MNRNGFDIGEYVSYGINGMCNIEDIRPMQLSQSVEKMMYYILLPESNPKSTIFVPVNNQKLVSKMREPMTKDEINAMLVRMKDRTLEWEKDVRFRTESFHDDPEQRSESGFDPDDTLSASQTSGAGSAGGKNCRHGTAIL